VAAIVEAQADAIQKSVANFTDLAQMHFIGAWKLMACQIGASLFLNPICRPYGTMLSSDFGAWHRSCFSVPCG
jgi:hypothetical protein